jgi:hypothetical protein
MTERAWLNPRPALQRTALSAALEFKNVNPSVVRERGREREAL